ncbi:MAG: hypothetical protein ACFFCS_18430 [Candidatus Hodarchaeota archaeon]
MDFALGIIMTLVGTTINSVGILLQKLDINRSGMKDDSNLSYFMKRPVWVLGILMQTIILLPFFILGIDLLGVTLAQPLATAGLLVFVLGSIFVLKEKLKRQEWAGVIMLVVAVLLIGLSGVVGDVTMAVFFQESFLANLIIFLVITAGLVVVGIIVIKVLEKQVLGYSIFLGVAYAIVSISGQLATPPLDMMFGTGLSAAGWILLLLGVAGVLLGTYFGILYSQLAFQKGQAIDVVPSSQAIINLLPVFAGLFLFGQYILFPVLFIAGMGLLLVSVVLLARFQK